MINDELEKALDEKVSGRVQRSYRWCLDFIGNEVCRSRSWSNINSSIARNGVKQMLNLIESRCCAELMMQKGSQATTHVGAFRSSVELPKPFLVTLSNMSCFLKCIETQNKETSSQRKFNARYSRVEHFGRGGMKERDVSRQWVVLPWSQQRKSQSN